jgi:hypothetical protein
VRRRALNVDFCAEIDEAGANAIACGHATQKGGDALNHLGA